MGCESGWRNKKKLYRQWKTGWWDFVRVTDVGLFSSDLLEAQSWLPTTLTTHTDFLVYAYTNTHINAGAPDKDTSNLIFSHWNHKHVSPTETDSPFSNFRHSLTDKHRPEWSVSKINDESLSQHWHSMGNTQLAESLTETDKSLCSLLCSHTVDVQILCLAMTEIGALKCKHR